MNAIKLSDHQLLQKAVAIHLKRLNPGVTVRKSKEPWLDWQALQTVDQWMLICTISFAVWALGIWEWMH